MDAFNQVAPCFVILMLIAFGSLMIGIMLDKGDPNDPGGP